MACKNSRQAHAAPLRWINVALPRLYLHVRRGRPRPMVALLSGRTPEHALRTRCLFDRGVSGQRTERGRMTVIAQCARA
jgi:hypothetical protein